MSDWTVDVWKYYDVTHRRHMFLNATSATKADELCELLEPKPGYRVLDVACGKAELLVRLVERYGVRGVGIDLSPPFAAAAEAKRKARVPDADLRILEMGGADYQSEEGEAFDIVMCLGASWIWQGHRGTLRALRGFCRPGGLVVTGEPYWIQEPCAKYLEASGVKKDDFSTHDGNVTIGEEEGLTFLYAQVSSRDDWDRYEGLQSYSASDFACAHAEDPDAAEIVRIQKAFREAYLRWGRDTLGWAIYLFRNP